MRGKNNIPLQQHETANKQLQSSEDNLKHYKLLLHMAGLGSAARRTTAEILETLDSYRLAPAQPGSPALVC